MPESTGLTYKEILLQGVSETSDPTVESTSSSVPSNVETSSATAVSTTSEDELAKSVSAIDISKQANIKHLVLDAGPLITQTYSEIKQFATKFYTTPAVFNEIRDERSRANLLLWGENLIIRQPSAEQTKEVVELAKKTGDYSVLSITDMQLLALCRELDVSEHEGSDEHLRKVVDGSAVNMNLNVTSNVRTIRTTIGELLEQEEEEKRQLQEAEKESDGWATVPSRKQKKSKSKNFHKSYENAETTEDQPKKTTSDDAEKTSITTDQSSQTEQPQEDTVLHEEDDDDEDDEGWITAENLEENLIKEQGEVQDKEDDKFLAAAVSTGDFAMQNVALRMGLNLVNPTNGRHITQVKSFMLRCHACFKLTPFPKDGSVKQFCPGCGGSTLMRCTVKISESGQIHVFLKRNMQWSTRGNKYSIPNPQSKASRRHNRTEMLTAQSQFLLREDQKEYAKAVKQDTWKKRQNEKILNEWIGPSVDGSVDSVTSPFAISGYKRDAARHTGVRVGAGRYINSSRRKK